MLMSNAAAWRSLELRRCLTPRHRIGLFPRLFFSRFSKTYTWTAAVLVDEFDAGRFQGLPERRFVGKGHWNFPFDDLYPANSRYADF
jgi:hypothetical protein